MLPVYGANIKEGKFDAKHAVIFAVIAVLANMIAFGVVTPIMTVLLYGGELTITFMQSFAATLSNITVLVLAGIPLLYALARRYAKGTNLSRE
jgi:energy-coupling factor transport system substrate-specific component